MKNNTLMLSCSQDKPLMLSSLKSVWRWKNYQTLNPLLFEKNLTEDYEDTAKKPQQRVIIMQSRLPASVPHKPTRIRHLYRSCTPYQQIYSKSAHTNHKSICKSGFQNRVRHKFLATIDSDAIFLRPHKGSTYYVLTEV